MDYRQVRALVHKTSGRGGHKEDERGRSRSPKGASKKQRGRVGGEHKLRGSDGRYRNTPTGKQICFEFNRNVGGCSGECPTKRAHVCVFCLEPHRTVECPNNPGWRPPKGVKRSRDTILESASSEKVAPGITVGGQSPRGVPSEGSGKEGVSPPRVVPNQVRGTYLEVADHRSPLLSGAVDVARVEPFDDVKVAVKRSEVDWLNIVPSPGWFGRVGTRLIKLCNVGLRKSIWWSVHILASGGEVESLMQLEGARRVSSPLGHVITNAPF